MGQVGWPGAKNKPNRKRQSMVSVLTMRHASCQTDSLQKDYKLQ